MGRIILIRNLARLEDSITQMPTYLRNYIHTRLITDLHSTNVKLIRDHEEAPCGIRTHDLPLTKRVLYQLS